MGRADMELRVPRARARFGELEARGLWRPTSAALRVLDAAAGLPRGVRDRRLRTATCASATPALRGRRADSRDRLGRPCCGDPAIDLSLVWSFLPRAGREAFFAAYGPVSEATLLRARVLALFLSGTLAVYAHREGRPTLEREALAGLDRAAAD